MNPRLRKPRPLKVTRMYGHKEKIVCDPNSDKIVFIFGYGFKQKELSKIRKYIDRVDDYFQQQKQKVSKR